MGWNRSQALSQGQASDPCLSVYPLSEGGLILALLQEEFMIVNLFADEEKKRVVSLVSLARLYRGGFDKPEDHLIISSLPPLS
jgi:hypothetical protein